MLSNALRNAREESFFSFQEVLYLIYNESIFKTTKIKQSNSVMVSKHKYI